MKVCTIILKFKKGNVGLLYWNCECKFHDGIEKKDNPRAPHIFLVYDYSARIYIPISIHIKVIV